MLFMASILSFISKIGQFLNWGIKKKVLTNLKFSDVFYACPVDPTET